MPPRDQRLVGHSPDDAKWSPCASASRLTQLRHGSSSKREGQRQVRGTWLRQLVRDTTLKQEITAGLPPNVNCAPGSPRDDQKDQNMPTTTKEQLVCAASSPGWVLPSSQLHMGVTCRSCKQENKGTSVVRTHCDFCVAPSATVTLGPFFGQSSGEQFLFVLRKWRSLHQLLENCWHFRDSSIPQFLNFPAEETGGKIMCEWVQTCPWKGRWLQNSNAIGSWDFIQNETFVP